MRYEQWHPLKVKLVLEPLCELISGEIKDITHVALVLKVVNGYHINTLEPRMSLKTMVNIGKRMS